MWVIRSIFSSREPILSYITSFMGESRRFVVHGHAWRLVFSRRLLTTQPLTLLTSAFCVLFLFFGAFYLTSFPFEHY